MDGTKHFFAAMALLFVNLSKGCGKTCFALTFNLRYNLSRIFSRLHKLALQKVAPAEVFRDVVSGFL